MKIIKEPVLSVTVELNIDEVQGLIKLIGFTNGDERENKFGLLAKESKSLSEMYTALCDWYDDKHEN